MSTEIYNTNTTRVWEQHLYHEHNTLTTWTRYDRDHTTWARDLNDTNVTARSKTRARDLHDMNVTTRAQTSPGQTRDTITRPVWYKRHDTSADVSTRLNYTNVTTRARALYDTNVTTRAQTRLYDTNKYQYQQTENTNKQKANKRKKVKSGHKQTNRNK